MTEKQNTNWESIYQAALGEYGLLANADKLRCLGQELLRWNKTHNLTGYSRWQQVALSLILDSLMMLPYCQGESCLDIGAGAGFPGLVLAMARPHMRVVLIDARRKRVSFQQHICRLLKLSNVTPVWGRAGEEPDVLKAARFATVTCKALAGLTQALNLCQHYMQENGIILLPRGIGEEEQCRALLKTHDPEWNYRLYYYTLPEFLAQRLILSAVKPGAPI